MANVQRNNRCKICDSLIQVERLRRHPCAVLCGSAACDVQHQRRRHNHAQQNWKRSRGQRDPEWRARQSELAGVRYRRRKQRLAKKKLAQRAPQTNGLATVDTSLPKISGKASALLAGAARGES